MIGSGATMAFIKATKASTSGGFTMSDTTIAAGFPGPPPHWHHFLTDTFYVLEGTLTVRLGDELVEARPGDYVCIPPGNPHTFSNRSEVPVRFLNINSPGGWEDYLRDVAKLLEGGGRPDPQQWRQVMAKYDFESA